jgi:hypothetical protein
MLARVCTACHPGQNCPAHTHRLKAPGPIHVCSRLLLLLLTHKAACNVLQVLVDQVLDVAVKPVHSYSRRAAIATQLFGITSAAIERYAAHLHVAATGLLRVSQVVLSPSSVVQSGKTTRHRRGGSVGSPATSR